MVRRYANKRTWLCTFYLTDIGFDDMVKDFFQDWYLAGLDENEVLEKIVLMVKGELLSLYHKTYAAVQNVNPFAIDVFLVGYEDSDIDFYGLASEYAEQYSSFIGKGNGKSASGSSNAKARKSDRSSKPKGKPAKVASNSTKSRTKTSQPRKANGQFARKTKGSKKGGSRR